MITAEALKCLSSNLMMAEVALRNFGDAVSQVKIQTLYDPVSCKTIYPDGTSITDLERERRVENGPLPKTRYIELP